MFNYRTKRYVQEQGGMYELYREFVDIFVNDGFKLREINSDSLYLHYGTENGKIGIQIFQKSINEVVFYVGEELPFNRKNEFKIETITQINSSMLFENLVSKLRLVKYPFKYKSDNKSFIDSANSLYRQGNFEEALMLYNEAEKIDRDNTKIILQQAGCYSKLGLNDEALELYRKAKRNDPQNSFVYLCLGQYHLDLNNPLQAMGAFKKGAALGCETCKAVYSKFSNEMYGE
jgi:tetratricopeptide (TPR) repeat protein